MRLGKYRHYKGSYYHVLGVAQNTETREKMVVYKALYPCPDLEEEYGKEPFFVRPFAMFHETVLVEGVNISRFEYVGAIE